MAGIIFSRENHHFLEGDKLIETLLSHHVQEIVAMLKKEPKSNAHVDRQCKGSCFDASFIFLCYIFNILQDVSRWSPYAKPLPLTIHRRLIFYAIARSF